MPTPEHADAYGYTDGASRPPGLRATLLDRAAVTSTPRAPPSTRRRGRASPSWAHCRRRRASGCAARAARSLEERDEGERAARHRDRARRRGAALPYVTAIPSSVPSGVADAKSRPRRRPLHRVRPDSARRQPSEKPARPLWRRIAPISTAVSSTLDAAPCAKPSSTLWKERAQRSRRAEERRASRRRGRPITPAGLPPSSSLSLLLGAVSDPPTKSAGPR